MIQIDGALRKVYIKFVDSERMMGVLQPIQGNIDFHHGSVEISKVTVEVAGVGIRRVCVSTLPPEVTEVQIHNAMAAYEEIKMIHDEVWSHAYRFRVKPGVRLVDFSLRKHIPSHTKTEGTVLSFHMLDST